MIFLYALLFTLIVSQFVNGEKCICPNEKIGHNIYDIGINSKYSTEWWYYLINVLDIESPILSQEIVWLRNGKICNGSSVYFYQENIMYRNLTSKNIVKFQIKNDIIGNKVFNIFNYSLYLNRQNNYKFKQVGINNNVTMEGFGYPQGRNKDGFVKTGKSNCDTSYTLSFPNLKVKINDKYDGIAYGEHVLTSTDSKTSPYSGWNCHYFHNLLFFSNINSYFTCESKYSNSSKRDPYRRSMILYNDNTTYWTTNFKLHNYFNWTDKVQNVTYPILWKIKILNDIEHYFVPKEIDGVIKFNNFPIHLWDSPVTILDENYREIGVGFSEILV